MVILLFNLLLVACYLGLATLLGIQICRWLGLRFQQAAGEWVAGLLMFEFSSFLVCWLAGNVFNLGIGSAFCPLLFLIYILTKGWTSTQFQTSVSSKSHWACVAASSCILILLSTITAWDQIIAVVTSQGVVYQDTIYHAGISRSIRELGFPIADLQFAGAEIKYHVFTHFFVAKLAFLTSWSEHQIYICLMPPLSAVMYSAAACSFLLGEEGSLNSGSKFVTGIIVILLPLFLVTLGGGSVVWAYVFSEIFSYSFAWQLIVFTLLLDYIRTSKLFKRNEIELWQALNFCLFLTLSTLIKGSSLPLIVSGFTALFLLRTITNRRVETSSCLTMACLTIFGVATYWLFFKGSGFATQNIALSVDSFDTTLWSTIASKISFDPPDFLRLVTLVGSIVTFRFVVFQEWKDQMAWFYLGCLSASIVFYLFLSNNPSYFLFPALFMGNLLALRTLRSHFKRSLWNSSIICSALMLLSIYPIANGGRLTVTKKLATNAMTYHPLTPERVELYRQLNKSVDSSELIFTPSVYATDKFSADNFYPAALSGRQFLLGGYRYGGLDMLPEFPQRRNLVDNFSLSDTRQLQMLKEDGVRFVLVEKLGNKVITANGLNEATTKKTALYQVKFVNSAGAIFSVP